jgi:hypothetical protein
VSLTSDITGYPFGAVRTLSPAASTFTTTCPNCVTTSSMTEAVWSRHLRTAGSASSIARWQQAKTHHKPRSGVCRFRRILYNYRVEYPTMDFLPVPRHARQEVVLWPWHLGHNVLFGIARLLTWRQHPQNDGRKSPSLSWHPSWLCETQRSSRTMLAQGFCDSVSSSRADHYILSFPKIISARSDDAIRTRLV